MKEFLIVAAGGGIGACVRYALSGFILHHTIQHKFPFGTFTVNVLGCLIAGLLLALAEKYDLLASDIRIFLFTGVLGGFTTFSAFGVETVYLIRRNELMIATSYIVFSLFFGLLALWLAYNAIPGKKIH